MTIKKYSICYNPEIENSISIMSKLTDILKNTHLEFTVSDIDNPSSNADFTFIIGGDGTILKAARFYSELDIPIFGINLGRLGFLSQGSCDNLENAVSAIASENYKIEERSMLTSGDYTALNDFVIKGETLGRTSRFALEINDKFVCEYLADGIIISTPTGSTAYSMAAGGAIITPEVEAISIVPICPHTFSARPIIVSINDNIKILPVKNNKYTVFTDGQVAFSLSETLTVKNHTKKAKLALLNGNDFYSVLRNKLQWGISPAKIS